MAQLDRKIGQQALEIDFLQGCLRRIDEQRKLHLILNALPEVEGFLPKRDVTFIRGVSL